MDLLTKDEKQFCCELFAYADKQFQKKEMNQNFTDLFVIQQKKGNKEILESILSKLLTYKIIEG